MRFEERILPPYGEPVSEDDLTEGSIYFSISFVDEDMFIPKMETIVFIGKNLDKQDFDSLYFQDIDSYQGGVRPQARKGKGHATQFKCSSNELKNIYDFEHALEVLMRCSLRQKKITPGASSK